MSSEQLLTKLKAGLAKADITLTDEQAEKQIQFVEMLAKWNKVYNLTAIRDIHEMVDLHLLDSLVILPHLQAACMDRPIKRLIDVGCGGGLPGVPLAICQPQTEFVLMDAREKKIRFIQQAKTQLALTNLDPMSDRVENYHPQQGFDVIISRAFASIADMLTWTHHLINTTEDGFSGEWWAMKGQYPEEELKELTKVSDTLGKNISVKETISLTVPGLDAERHLIKLALSE